MIFDLVRSVKSTKAQNYINIESYETLPSDKVIYSGTK